MSPVSLARRERLRLAETAAELGPDAVTLLEGWTATELIAHLLVRERQPYGAAGIAVPPLSGLTELAMRRASRDGFETMVRRFRDPRWTPFRAERIERLVNTLEFFVHHEDLRRARPTWRPRGLPQDEQDQLWVALQRMTRVLLRRTGAPVVLQRSEADGSTRVGSGADPVTVTGAPEELGCVSLFHGLLRGALRAPGRVVVSRRC